MVYVHNYFVVKKVWSNTYMPSKKEASRTKIVLAIRLAYDSLESHLDSSVKQLEKNACCQKAVGDPSFHRKCVREYAEIIHTLASHL